jgi:hypothetical protein
MPKRIESNRLATPEQEALELHAARLLAHPVVQDALPGLKEYWLAKVQPSSELHRLFDWEFEQTAFCGVLNTLNQDSDDPKIHAFGRFGHTLSGTKIPGTKHGHPNPDYIYWFAPVNGESHYILRGETGNAPPAAAEISLLNDRQVYLGNLSLHQIVVDGGGKFAITIDPDPAGDRVNHLQTRPGAFQLLIRNIVGDMESQQPMRFRIERLGSTLTQARTDGEIAPLCGPAIKKLIDDLLFVNANFIMSRPVNTFENPTFNDGGLYAISQAYAPGHFHLEDDEALVFTLTLGNAAYAVVPVTNIWGGIGHYLNRVGSLGTGGARPSADGSYTIVVSLRDPGTDNWVDTGGLHDGVVFVRWAGFDPKTGIDAKPTLACQRMKLSELKAALPPDTRWVGEAERRRQLERHASDYSSFTG